MSKEMSRRSFLKTGTAVAAGIAVAPNIIIAGEKTPKKEKKKRKPVYEIQGFVLTIPEERLKEMLLEMSKPKSEK